MSFESDFSTEMFRQTVTVAAVASRNADGSVNYSTSATSYAARVRKTAKQMRDQSGQVVMAGHVVWLASTGTIDPNSKVTLPDGLTPPVLQVDSYPDEDGAYHHNRILLGF